MKIILYSNSCMFYIPSQKIVLNSQCWNIPKSKTSKSDFSKTWREKRQNIQDIIIQIRLFLQVNVKIKILVHGFYMKLWFLTVLWYKYEGKIC